MSYIEASETSLRKTGQIKLHVRAPTGIRVEQTAAQVDHIEAAIRRVIPSHELASIVDNIGLNGVLIPKEQSERQIFLTAAKWVQETDRLCYAISNEAGRQTSLPVLIKVRQSAGQVASAPSK